MVFFQKELALSLEILYKDFVPYDKDFVPYDTAF